MLRNHNLSLIMEKWWSMLINKKSKVTTQQNRLLTETTDVEVYCLDAHAQHQTPHIYMNITSCCHGSKHR